MNARRGYQDGIVRYPVSVNKQPEENYCGASQEALNDFKKDILKICPVAIVTGHNDL